MAATARQNSRMSAIRMLVSWRHIQRRNPPAPSGGGVGAGAIVGPAGGLSGGEDMIF